MTDFLYSIDTGLLYFFNVKISNPAFDKFFVFITSVSNWYITYILLLGILFINSGKKGKIAGVLVILLVVFTDQFGHNVLKELFGRIRPCNVLDWVLTPNGCSGTLSFPSNHALNNFAVAMFFYVLYPKLKWALFITAGLIAFSRVYLGLHYPSDIIGGALIGCVIGYLFARLHLLIEKKIVK